jgi:hypothetical protein
MLSLFSISALPVLIDKSVNKVLFTRNVSRLYEVKI